MSESHAWEGKRTPTVEVQIEVGRAALQFTYQNTWLVGFSNYFQEDPVENHEHRNYIVHKEPDGNVIYINESPGLFEQLDDLSYPMIRKPYPSAVDDEEYGRFIEQEFSDLGLSEGLGNE